MYWMWFSILRNTIARFIGFVSTLLDTVRHNLGYAFFKASPPKNKNMIFHDKDDIARIIYFVSTLIDTKRRNSGYTFL